MQRTRANLTMSLSASLLLVVALFAMGWGTDSHAGKRTVCTITVNSSDEKEMLRQRLPADRYEFVRSGPLLQSSFAPTIGGCRNPNWSAC